MVAPKYDFTANHIIRVNGVVGYYPGDGIMADAVEALGLVIGEDVTPAHSQAVARPAGNAARRDWAAYAVAQGADPVEVDDMTRDQIRDQYPEDTGMAAVDTEMVAASEITAADLEPEPAPKGRGRKAE